MLVSSVSFFFFFNDTATTEIYTLSLHDALPISALAVQLDQHGDLAAQDLRHDRYGHVVDRPDLVALEAVEVGHVPAGDEDDGSLLEARMLVGQPCRLETVHFRHADMQQSHGTFLGP